MPKRKITMEVDHDESPEKIYKALSDFNDVILEDAQSNSSDIMNIITGLLISSFGIFMLLINLGLHKPASIILYIVAIVPLYAFNFYVLRNKTKSFKRMIDAQITIANIVMEYGDYQYEKRKDMMNDIEE